MTGLKFKIAHKRADKGKWSASGPTQRKHLIGFLKEYIAQLEKEPVPIEGVPVMRTCAKGICYELVDAIGEQIMAWYE